MPVSVPSQPLTPFSKTKLDYLFAGYTARTGTTVEDELWLNIKSYSVVQKNGKGIAARHGCPPNLTNAAWLRYQGYIKAAESYWRAASLTEWQTSPLLYYYCFLNLVKGVLVLPNPTIPRRMGHGLSYDPSTYNAAFSKQKVRLTQNNNDVFNRYTRLYSSNTPPQHYLIKDLLAYASDIGSQYSTIGQPKIWPIKYRVVADSTHTWYLFSVHKEAKLQNNNSVSRNLLRQVNKVNLRGIIPNDLDDLFKYKLNEWQNIDLYETRAKLITDPYSDNNLRQAFKQCLGDNLGMTVYNDGTSGQIGLMHGPRKNIYMNEPLSIYAVMFYLSSLVRYEPGYLYKLDGTTSAWLYESFVKSCVMKFLRHYVCLLEQQNAKHTSI